MSRGHDLETLLIVGHSMLVCLLTLLQKTEAAQLALWRRGFRTSSAI